MSLDIEKESRDWTLWTCLMKNLIKRCWKKELVFVPNWFSPLIQLSWFMSHLCCERSSNFVLWNTLTSIGYACSNLQSLPFPSHCVYLPVECFLVLYLLTGGICFSISPSLLPLLPHLITLLIVKVCSLHLSIHTYINFKHACTYRVYRICCYTIYKYITYKILWAYVF